VAEALLALIDEGDLRPTAPRIASRAGVSLRLVFHHFKDLEAIFAEAARRQLERVLPTLVAVSDQGAFAPRLESFVGERVRLLERVSTIWRAANIQEPFSKEIARRMQVIRAWMHSETERVFSAELKRARGSERQELIGAISAVASMPFWHQLRFYEELPADRAKRSLMRALAALLEPLARRRR
jgi:AcrR family transcriptional regulator